MSKHRTNRPTFPRLGAGEHRPERVPSVVRRLSLAFVVGRPKPNPVPVVATVAVSLVVAALGAWIGATR